MLHVFHQIFRVTKSSIQVQIKIGGSISGAGGLYGTLFEPWFHNRITERGYMGRFRELEKAPDGNSAAARRNLLGRIKSTKYKIPILPQNRFYHVSEIQPEKYNIPLNKNFPMIDSLCPARGEMFQVTWSENHRIKAQYLMSLKPKFKQFLKDNPNKKVKMIFVVPPHNFNTFRRQSYLGLAAADPPTDPTSNTTQALQPKKKSSSFNVRSKTTKTKATESAGGTTEDEIESWIVQCVLDMDVNPLEEALHSAKN